MASPSTSSESSNGAGDMDRAALSGMLSSYDSKQLVDEVIKLYEGNQIESLVTRGLKLAPICEGFESCIERLQEL